jgi:hypothetical protein
MNYRIIGADQRIYGPASAEQMEQWIREGRANAGTLVQGDGVIDWKPVGQWPEFADALRSHASLPPPRLGGTPLMAEQPQQAAQAILNRGFSVDIGRYLGRGWDLVCRDFWPIIGVNALVQLVLFATNMVTLGIVLTGPLLGGLYYYHLLRVRGQTPVLEDAFCGFNRAFLHLFLAQLVMTLLVAIGLICCVLPGIYIAVCWMFALLLVVDRQIDFWSAMDISRRVVAEHWISFFLLALVNLLLVCVGGLVCCVGQLVAVPVTMCALAVAYDEIFNGVPVHAA